MGKSNIDIKDLLKFQKKIQKLQKEQQQFSEECVKKLAARLLEKVIKRTPKGNYSIEVEVVAKRNSKYHKKGETYKKRINPSGKTGGTLQQGWTISTVTKTGNVYNIEVINPVFYVTYVEYGHRQKPGRYVPAIGKKLKKGWVEGKFMLTISEQELQEDAPKIIEKRLNEFLKGCFDD